MTRCTVILREEIKYEKQQVFYALKIFGYSAENPLGLQLCGPLAGSIILLSLIVFSKYSLTEKELEKYKLDSKK